jgi:hypothetical protein
MEGAMSGFRTWAAGLALAAGAAASVAAQPTSLPQLPAARRPPPQATTPAETQPQFSSSTAAEPVIDVQQVQLITRQMQRELNVLGGVAQITHCGPVLRLVTPQTGGFDESYGAVCELQIADHHAQAVMCDDRRGVKFTLTLAQVTDVDSIRQFIINNCLPVG